MGPTITTPLHILHLSTPSTPHPALLKDIDVHEIRTAYYNASIPIWRDEAPTSPDLIEAWKAEWKGSEAGEVVQAVGAWIVCFRKPRIQNDLDMLRVLLSTISSVVEHHTSSSSCSTEPLLLAVAMQQTTSPSLDVSTEEWEDLCRKCGSWEWIDGAIDGLKGKREDEERNEFGENIGVARLREALEANEWDAGGGDGLSDGLGVDDGEMGFGEEAAEMQTEMWGLQSAVREEEEGEEETLGARDGRRDLDEGGDEGVLELEAMMLKMQAVRDMGADLPEAERRNFAAKAVKDVLKHL